VLPRPAHADVFGRLHLIVKNAADEKPVAGATVTLHDSAGVRSALTLSTDASGAATSPPLEARGWAVQTTADAFQPDSRTAAVAADSVADVEILLEPLSEKVIKISGQREIVQSSQAATGTQRDQQFAQRSATNVGNPTSLAGLVKTTPGMVEDSAGQLHPRGAHSATTVYINGFQLPGAFQGRAGQVLSASTVQSLDVLVGGFAPEYGGETAAILNVNLRSGPIVPIRAFSLEGGEFKTFDGGVTLGGQSGHAMGMADDEGRTARSFGYLIDLQGRTTDNALAPPQPDDQTAHDDGQSYSAFGNFDFHAGDHDQVGVTLNAAPAHTQVANRTGLPAKYEGFGQGFGYAGDLDASSGLPSQQDLGQDVYQDDENWFGVVNWRHAFSDTTTGMFSFGAIHAGLEIKNRNPAIDLDSLPEDSSIEFNPTLSRKADSAQLQASVATIAGHHSVKGGLFYDWQRGDESYEFIPASQVAVDALAETDTRLLPPGTFTGATDSRDREVYLLDPGATPVSLPVSRHGHYGGAYIQDTWKANSHVTVNYGARLDDYAATQDLGQPDVTETEISPRLNLAFDLGAHAILRASINRLFIEPPASQGSVIGQPIQPEKLWQYDASIEKQMGSHQAIKLAAYYKGKKNETDTGILIEGTQIGAYATVNIPQSQVRGAELSYELLPVHDLGWGAYVSYAYCKAEILHSDELFNDHDQRHTLSAGASYKWARGMAAAADFSYGSGLASSPITEGAPRSSVSSVNAKFDSGPELFKGKGGLELSVANLLDERDRINFRSAFSGTRFEQGRRILLMLYFRF
jgi:outer membrane receptor protein involved in Fe transport